MLRIKLALMVTEFVGEFAARHREKRRLASLSAEERAREARQRRVQVVVWVCSSVVSVATAIWLIWSWRP